MHRITPAGTMAALFYDQWHKAHYNYHGQEATSENDKIASANAMSILQSAMLAEHLDPEPLCGEVTNTSRCVLGISHKNDHVMRPYFLPQ